MRVAFTPIGNSSWTGGVHYLKNLLYALKKLPGRPLSPVLIVGNNVSVRDTEIYLPFVDDVVETGCFTMWHPGWCAKQLIRRLIDRDLITERLLKSNKIDVAFHIGLLGGRFGLPSVSWIADLQHMHMPEMFTAAELNTRDHQFYSWIRTSRRLVVSSCSARDDMLMFSPSCAGKLDVLRFVAQLPAHVYDALPTEVLKGYGLPDRFFHLPSQFWKHKNHSLVIDALKILKERKDNVFVVCTGSEKDYRNPGYFNLLKEKIKEYDVESNIALLGLVPIEDLYAFMRQSVAVLNPSLFEGWSTTVEEAKSLGKRVLVSDISVHREQDAPGAAYFNPMDPEDLADKMSIMWKGYMPGPDLEMEENARSLLESRTIAFGREFFNILERAKKCDKI